MSHALSYVEILNRKRLAEIGGGKRLVKINSAATYCDVDPRTIRRRIADGTIHGYRVGDKAIRVDLNEIDEKLLRPIPTAV